MPEAGERVIELYRHDDGDTLRVIHVQILDDGRLRLGAQDVGGAPERVWGDSDYEWWVDVPAEHRERLLLCLVARCFKGRAEAVDEFRAWLHEQGIPCHWRSWV